MRIGHIKGIILSGMVWLVIGGLLTYKGLVLTAGMIMNFQEGVYPLMNMLNRLFENSERSGMCLVFLAILLGQLKGTFVLSKTVKKFVKRILLIPSPVPIKELFPWKYLLLIGFMMSLGMMFRFLPISRDVKAFIDLAVGSALISGAFLYFKQASLLKLEFSRKKK